MAEKDAAQNEEVIIGTFLNCSSQSFDDPTCRFAGSSFASWNPLPLLIIFGQQVNLCDDEKGDHSRSWV
jgi:hypothetical protein